jgi:lysophospholipase L1-like esterase
MPDVRRARGTHRAPGRPARLRKFVLGSVGVFVLVFVATEGFLSILLVTLDLANERVSVTRRHTRHDAELGWVAIPNLHLPDMYGPGVYLKTNSRGFRGDRELTEAVPRGKSRVVCSGDSVTLGYGVDDDHSWCKVLELLDHRIETVNMGQSGYGVDQAYLWYKRDAAAFRHHVHLFAPIVDDFRRMQSSVFFGGYPKPLLVVENGSLLTKNVPVPAHAYRVPWLTEGARHLRSLRSVQVLHRLLRRPDRVAPSPSETEQNERTAQVVAKVIEDLKRVNEERSSSLVLVYLPTLSELDSEDANFWGAVLEHESKVLGIRFINLVAEFKKLHDEEALALYFPTDLGHFSTKGNEYVAKLIYRRLKTFPEISRNLFAGSEH